MLTWKTKNNSDASLSSGVRSGFPKGNPAYNLQVSGPLQPLFFLFLFFYCSLALAHAIDMDAIAEIESSNNPNAVGSSGEIGLYQISPIVLKHFNQVHENQTIRAFVGEWPLKKAQMFFGHYDDTSGFISSQHGFSEPTLVYPAINTIIANWYMNWLYERCWTIEDTIIAWNWGIGNWRDWKNGGSEIECVKIPTDTCVLRRFKSLPKTTQKYLAKYEKITGEKL